MRLYAVQVGVPTGSKDFEAELSVDVVTDVAELSRLAGPWDALAAENGFPLMSARIVGAWWRHMAPPHLLPRVVVARDDDRIVGIAPFAVSPARSHRPTVYSLPGQELGARISPLAATGREWDVARATTLALAEIAPRPDLLILDSLPVVSSWPTTLRLSSPKSLLPVARQHSIRAVPVLSLAHDSFDEWLSSKSSNFRSQMRRFRRRFSTDGGTARLSTPASFDDDIATLLELHESRWADRGSSSVVAIADRLTPMLRDIGAEQSGDGRLRLWMLELKGRAVAAQLFSALGGHVTYLNGGWDERFFEYRPALLGILAAIEDAFGRKDVRFDFGPGDQHYKRRFADSNDPVAFNILIMSGSRTPLTLMQLTPGLTGRAARDMAKRVLTADQLDRARSLRRTASSE